jgi:glucuronoarabinoxylan endo-1,4-beta-xylanase
MEMTVNPSIFTRFYGRSMAAALIVLAGLKLPAMPVGGAEPAGRTASVQAAVNPSETHQTIEGFGGSLYYYSNWLTAHPNKEDIYISLFDDLGVDILRLGNTYRPGKALSPDAAEFVSKAGEFSGRPVKVLISSWSPPAELKSNGSEKNGGTLVKNNGVFDYEGFADYWTDALDAYAAAGIEPEYISIQNEPGFVATWESCELMQTETSTKAGYGKALEAVARKMRDGGYQSKILASEVLGIGYNLFQNYAKNFDHGLVYGYAHHLYHGGDPKKPDKFLDNMRIMARDYGDKPRFQTEYSSGDADWLNTAWIIHNSLTVEEVSAYLHWSLAWEAGNNAELVQLEFPWDRGRWTTPAGYILTDRYWAFRQYAKFIDPGWKRITASCASDSLRISAFISGDGDSLTAVVLNLSRSAESLSLDTGGYTAGSGRAFRTSETDKGADLGPFDPSSPVNLPGRSITTIVLTGSPSAAPETAPHPSPFGFFLESNFPNPFNGRTLIRFGLARRSDAALRVMDLKGRTVRELRLGTLSEGPHQVFFDSDGLAAGVYLVRLETGDGMSAAGRMVLAK